MASNEQEVEKLIGEASADQDDGKNLDSETSPESPEAKMAAMQAEIEKLQHDRDIYRDGLLALKGKKGTTVPEKPKTEQPKTEGRSTEGNSSELARIAKENAELRAALQSNVVGFSSGSGAGSNEGMPSREEKYWSPDQSAELEKRLSSLPTSRPIDKAAALKKITELSRDKDAAFAPMRLDTK